MMRSVQDDVLWRLIHESDLKWLDTKESKTLAVFDGKILEREIKVGVL